MMGGRIRSSGLGQDRHGLWREACRELADDLNHDDRQVWELWKELAVCREFHSRYAMHRDVHEEQAHRDCREILDSRGRAPS